MHLENIIFTNTKVQFLLKLFLLFKVLMCMKSSFLKNFRLAANGVFIIINFFNKKL